MRASRIKALITTELPKPAATVMWDLYIWKLCMGLSRMLRIEEKPVTPGIRLHFNPLEQTQVNEPAPDAKNNSTNNT
jgi:hypothetical protein